MLHGWSDRFKAGRALALLERPAASHALARRRRRSCDRCSAAAARWWGARRKRFASSESEEEEAVEEEAEEEVEEEEEVVDGIGRRLRRVGRGERNGRRRRRGRGGRRSAARRCGRSASPRPPRRRRRRRGHGSTRLRLRFALLSAEIDGEAQRRPDEEPRAELYATGRPAARRRCAAIRSRPASAREPSGSRCARRGGASTSTRCSSA